MTRRPLPIPADVPSQARDLVASWHKTHGREALLELKRLIVEGPSQKAQNAKSTTHEAWRLAQIAFQFELVMFHFGRAAHSELLIEPSMLTLNERLVAEGFEPIKVLT